MHSRVALPRSIRKTFLPWAGAATLLLAAAAGAALRAAEHTLLPTPQTVHIGYFLATVKPVLTTNLATSSRSRAWPSIVPSVIDESGVVPPSAVPHSLRDIYRAVKDRGPGPHVLTGPIVNKGAEPGECWKCASSRSRSRSTRVTTARPYPGVLPRIYRALAG